MVDCATHTQPLQCPLQQIPVNDLAVGNLFLIPFRGKNMVLFVRFFRHSARIHVDIYRECRCRVLRI